MIYHLAILGSVFTILGSGEVSLLGSLDRETLDNYQLVIEVDDSGISALTTTTTLTITVAGTLFDLQSIC